MSPWSWSSTYKSADARVLWLNIRCYALCDMRKMPHLDFRLLFIWCDYEASNDGSPPILPSIFLWASFVVLKRFAVLNVLCLDYITSHRSPLQMKPCQNGGECTITFNDFTCSCPEEYTGKTCETRVWCVSGPCVNGGHCVDLPDGYECKSTCIIL